ncbi:MAG: CPBP family intramembrane metalloprotease, partial [Burkholderiales bacterium]|nr:CPBP family intramembrane metalloprotease [Anaerolineae bacterium]
LEIVLYKKGVDRTLSDIGVTRFSARGVILAALFSLLLLAFFPLFSLFTGIPLTLRGQWTWLMILTIFNILSLEVMMRGFVFRHLRENWSFWRAAALPPLFYAVATAIAIVTAAQGLSLGSLLLSSLIPVPIGLLSAYLYERGSNTLWGSVLLQFVVNALLSTVITPASPIGFHQLFFYPMIGITSAIVVVWIYLRGFGRETAPLPMEVINP